MIENIFDKEGNKIGTGEYIKVNKKMMDGWYGEKMREIFSKNKEQLRRMVTDEEKRKITIEDFEKWFEKANHYKIILDINGKYFHHHHEEYSGFCFYSQSKRKRGHPKMGVNYYSKEERKKLREEEKEKWKKMTKSEREKKKDIEAFLGIWAFKKQKNIWTHFYNKKGESVGNMEEGLDTWWECNLQIKKNRYFRIWYHPEDNNKIVDRRTYKGFKNYEENGLLLDRSFFDYLIE